MDRIISEHLVSLENPRSIEISEVIFNIESAFNKLNISNWEIPSSVSLQYIPSKEDKPILGRVLCYSDDDVRIEYDDRFKTEDSEKEMLEKYCPSYPGLKQTLVHELGHIAMWSLTKNFRQPATRLLDEGFAKLIEDLSNSDLSLEDLKLKSKKFLVEKYTSGDISFQKSMNISSISSGVPLGNGAEHAVGESILLWVLESKGTEAMISLLKNSPARGKNILYGFEPNNILATTSDVYLRAVLDNQNNSIENGIWEDKSLLDWETSQFQKALVSITGLDNILAVEDVFKNWVVS